MPRSGFRRRFGSSWLGEPKGYVTRKPPIYPITVLLQAIQRALPRPKTRSQRTRVFGYITRKPPIRRITVQSFAAKQRALPRPKTRSFWTHVFGHPTGRPPIRPIRVILQARQYLSARRRTHVFLGRPTRALAVIVSRFPSRVRAVLSDSLPRRPVHVYRTRTFGYVTRRPPVRRPKVLSFASQQAAQRRYIYFNAILGRVVRTFAPVPGAVGDLIYLLESGRFAKRVRGLIYIEL